MSALDAMMDESKDDLVHNHHEGDEEGVEEDVYLENESGMMVHGMQIGYAEEEEVPPCEDDDIALYGGMEHEVYDAIVEYKRSGRYPDGHLADQRVDRSAHCHWRLRCGRFNMHEDEMTLMYTGGSEAASLQPPKFVIKKGEVKGMIDRVHTLIGHVGTKRTQAALQKKMYWRSVRNDVMQFVSSCGFCQRKKNEGKKLSKAPIDISSENFDLSIEVEYTSIPGERIISVNLDGFDEAFVEAAAISRMTSYTFRSTDSGHRKMYSTPPFFKRQPYRRNARYDHNSGPSFLVPVLSRDSREPAYMSLSTPRVSQLDRMGTGKNKYHIGQDIEDDEEEDEEELTPVDPNVAGSSRAPSAASELAAAAADEAAAAASAGGPSTSRQRPPQSRPRALRPAKVYDPNHPAYRRSTKERSVKDVRHQRRNDHGAMRGAASRLSSMMTHSGLRGDRPSSASASSLAERQILYGQSNGLVGHDLVSTYDEISNRPESAMLAPVLLIPSNDPEVAELQKELLTRQLEIQKMQLQMMRAHMEGNRYEEDVNVDGRDDAEELNVIDTDDRY